LIFHNRLPRRRCGWRSSCERRKLAVVSRKVWVANQGGELASDVAGEGAVARDEDGEEQELALSESDFVG
jgi:hypothetical protein